ncbi:MAG: hypothetical protein V7L27_33115 [Nostoc sp.]|uniref:hypothetical protein n=1 Tax=Nostoc sp. TaxID=1180 RepID=UPI002FFA44D0
MSNKLIHPSQANAPIHKVDKFDNIAESALQTPEGSDPRLLQEVGDLFVHNSCKDCYIILTTQRL